MKKLTTTISGITKLTTTAFNILSKVSSIEYVNISSKNELKKALKECDIFWFRLNHKISHEVIREAKCKYILCAVTGLDHIDLVACSKKGIIVVSLKNEQEFLKEVRATAEHSFGLMLSLIRKSKPAFLHTESYQWNRNLFQGEELYKKNIGILGFGRLGKIVASYANAFGMNVFYFDKLNETHSKYKKCKSLEELISKIDILSIHITYDASTEFMVDDSVLEKIKKGIYIINTSRGGVVNEVALLKQIISGKVKGYATDVLNNEPSIKNNILISYAKNNENVIITPHIAGYTKESIEKTEIFIANKILEIIKNR